MFRFVILTLVFGFVCATVPDGQSKNQNIDSPNLAVLNSTIQVRTQHIWLGAQNDNTIRTVVGQNANCSIVGHGNLHQILKELRELREVVDSFTRKPNITAKDCSDLYKQGLRDSGVYTIQLSNKKRATQVYCDMKTDGGGWTVFQRRQDGSIDFYRDWTNYKNGFGNPGGEFWLGNDIISSISNQDSYTLRVDMMDTSGKKSYAAYDYFSITSERTEYKLSLGTYSGNAGAWWYAGCHSSNLNGIYHHGGHKSHADGVNWKTFMGYKYSLKRTEMKLRPSDW